MSGRYSLAEARKIIDWHDGDGRWGAMDPTLADVAAQLPATVERVEALVETVTDDDCSCGGCGSCTYHDCWKPLLLAAINGEEVTE